MNGAEACSTSDASPLGIPAAIPTYRNPNCKTPDPRARPRSASAAAPGVGAPGASWEPPPGRTEAPPSAAEGSAPTPGRWPGSSAPNRRPPAGRGVGPGASPSDHFHVSSVKHNRYVLHTRRGLRGKGAGLLNEGSRNGLGVGAVRRPVRLGGAGLGDGGGHGHAPSDAAVSQQLKAIQRQAGWPWWSRRAGASADRRLSGARRECRRRRDRPGPGRRRLGQAPRAGSVARCGCRASLGRRALDPGAGPTPAVHPSCQRETADEDVATERVRRSDRRLRPGHRPPLRRHRARHPVPDVGGDVSPTASRSTSPYRSDIGSPPATAGRGLADLVGEAWIAPPPDFPIDQVGAGPRRPGRSTGPDRAPLHTPTAHRGPGRPR